MSSFSSNIPETTPICKLTHKTHELCYDDYFMFADSTEHTSPIKDTVYKSILRNATYNGFDSIVIEDIVVKSCDLIPNVITPNNDGFNDYFYSDIFYEGLWKLNVYNRWGKLVYTHSDYDGDFDGNGLVDGTYYYKVTNEDITFKGTLQIIR